MNEAERKDFYELFGSRVFKLQGDINKTYGEKKINIYFKLVEFTNQIVTVIGVISGLGFTALVVIDNKFLFASGEALLFAGILMGIFFVHRIYSGELLGLQQATDTHKEYFKKRNEVFRRVWKDVNSAGVAPKDIRLLKEIGEEMLQIFSSNGEGVEFIKKLKSYQRTLLYLLGSGCILILCSIVS